MYSSRRSNILLPLSMGTIITAKQHTRRPLPTTTRRTEVAIEMALVPAQQADPLHRLGTNMSMDTPVLVLEHGEARLNSWRNYQGRVMAGGEH